MLSQLSISWPFPIWLWGFEYCQEKPFLYWYSFFNHVFYLLWTECLCLHKIHVKNLTSNVMVLGGRTFERWWGHEDRVPQNGISTLLTETPESFLLPSAMWGHSDKAVVYELGSKSHQTPNLLAPWPWTSQPSKLLKINLCCL